MSTTATFTRTCILCGASMENVGATRKFCPSCRAKRAVETMCARKAEKRAAEKKAREEALIASQKKAAQKNSITDICARAQTAGRSYGQQVAYEKRQKELKERGEI